MSDSIISQLKEYATVIADDIVLENGDGEFTEDLQATFERAIGFSELICPACWVKDNQTSELTTESKTDSMESYSCSKCDFSEELAKAD